MRTIKALITFCVVLLNSHSVLAQTEGFYKDLFMDGGVGLTSKTSLPASDALNLEMEYLASDDNALQTQIFIENSNDQNGFLLYPDGAPRFAMIYTNGGGATNHGESLGETGRERIRTFYYNGGSYSGSCAGAFIASISYKENGIHEPYYHIWPGRTEQANLAATYTGHFIPENSPLLYYSDFGNDLYIANVYHNYGCFAREDLDFPANTEVLLRYDYPAKSMHNKPSCWAYTENEQSGRIVVIGSHPESVTSGERLDLMKAILSYALDGVAAPQVKGTLINGQTRFMNKSSSEGDPAFTKIGDKQYHHFAVDLPACSKNFSVTLTGNDDFDLNLYIKQGDFAFEGNADFTVNGSGANKTFTSEEISSGKWYIAVKCITTVQATRQSWGYSYSGKLRVLNGVAYSLLAEWDTSATAMAQQHIQPKEFHTLQNYPNPFNPITTIRYRLSAAGRVQLTVFNGLGQKIRTLLNARQQAGTYSVPFNAAGLPSGIYYYKLQTGSGYSEIKKMVLLQ